jgi:hypothetical protein
LSVEVTESEEGLKYRVPAVSPIESKREWSFGFSGTTSDSRVATGTEVVPDKSSLKRGSSQLGSEGSAWRYIFNAEVGFDSGGAHS